MSTTTSRAHSYSPAHSVAIAITRPPGKHPAAEDVRDLMDVRRRSYGGGGSLVRIVCSSELRGRRQWLDLLRQGIDAGRGLDGRHDPAVPRVEAIHDRVVRAPRPAKAE